MKLYDPTPSLCNLDGRVLHATPPQGRCASLIADRAGRLPDIALSTLRDRGLVDDDRGLVRVSPRAALARRRLFQPGQPPTCHLSG